ncbi:hypothetical protein E1B28_013609 [Marasmius oreades]|uniref:Uncharacterized protein n=1 Tax=Marasmius oreades TaxID=181124 RepID=A0A9P7UP68_9AGAR|nr:uncharacterized protein E1B28_013609 [Marasmius oreades]KAG7087661.1 hypothetical protein E1B28_013609 [Marasmius oreades]
MAKLLPLWTNDFLLFIAVELVTVPFSNVLLRYRVGHQQNNGQLRGLLTDQLYGIPTFLKTVQRIHNIEGVAGFYKGFFARLIELFIFTFVFKIAFGFHPAILPIKLLYTYPDFTLLQCLIYYGSTVLISVPMKVFITRSTTTRFRLSQADPSHEQAHAFKVLLSPTEHQNPLALYLIPGLFTCIALQTLFSFISLATIYHLIQFYLSHGQPGWVRKRARIVYIVLFLMSRALVYTPFEVVACRLAVMGQSERDDGAAVDMADLEATKAGDEESETEMVPTFSLENVIQLRENVVESDSYEGFRDCVIKIRREEGFSALFRGWLGSLVGTVCI